MYTTPKVSKIQNPNPNRQANYLSTGMTEDEENKKVDFYNSLSSDIQSARTMTSFVNGLKTSLIDF